MASARIEIETPRWLRLVRDRKVIAEARFAAGYNVWEIICADGYGTSWDCYEARADVLERLMEIAEMPAPKKDAA